MLRALRWAWERVRGRPPAPAPGLRVLPHPPYYGDMAQQPDRDYHTKEQRPR